MGIKHIKEVTCDHCQVRIPEGEIWIDYGVAGIVIRWDCIRGMSALDFIRIAHENGDQMFINDSVDTTDYGSELKHLKWEPTGANMKNILQAYRVNSA